MDSTTIVGESRSISKPPYFDGKNCAKWKRSMMIFIQSVDFKLWLVIKNGPKVPKNSINGEEFDKCEDEFNDDDMKMMEQEARAKHILSCALSPDDLERVSSCHTAKEMWDELDKEVTTSHANLIAFDVEVLFNTPNLEFLLQSDEGKEMFLNLCVPIHKFALEGNWQGAKRIIEKENTLKNAAITYGCPTLLHIAAGANQIEFVKQLLKMLDDNDLELQDINGNTAFTFAAANGNMKIVNLMLERNSQLPTIRGGKGYTPIQYAALQGRYKMTWHLYDKTIHCFQEEDWNLLFFACIYTGIYDLALKMVRCRNELAFARDVNNDTALHILAQDEMPFDSYRYGPEHDHNLIMINPHMKNQVVFQLVKFLWTTILDKYYDSDSEFRKIRNEPSQLIFDAAKVGNFGFLSELISGYPSLIWDVDSKNRTIIHIAVIYRHASIFNLVHKIGHIKGVIVTYEDEEGNTLLHLAAKLAPRSQLELVSGAAFQMCLELLWFEKVKKIMLPALIKSRNSDGLTAQELFSNEHEKLRENAESWMKKTAESCMLISTVIATGVFTAALSLPGGTNDDTGKPNYLPKTSFLVFALSFELKSPPMYRTPVKVEEEVIVMDDIQVRPMFGGKSGRSSSSSSSRGSSSSSSSNKSLFKTEICRAWEESGNCRFNSKCQFAHVREELHPGRFSMMNKSEAQMGKISTKPGPTIYNPNTRTIQEHQEVAEPEPERAVTRPIIISQPTSPEHRRMHADFNTTSDWSPLDDGIECFLPTCLDRVLSREEVDAHIFGILNQPTSKRRLPVFAALC